MSSRCSLRLSSLIAETVTQLGSMDAVERQYARADLIKWTRELCAITGHDWTGHPEYICRNCGQEQE